MKNILIPINFSETSLNAIYYAMALFKDIHCRFTLLYVNIDGLDHRRKPLYDLGTNILVEKEPLSIDRKLKDLEKSLRSISLDKKRHRFITVQEKGYFLESIRKHVQKNKVELIIMGTKGASQLVEFFMGSNAGDVITKVECDVLVIPQKAQYQGFTEVMIPVDFSLTYSDDIFKGISNIITSKTTLIRVFHAAKSEKPLSSGERVRKENLMQSLTELLPNPISFHLSISKNVENAVLDFAKEMAADLIIMISKDHGFLHKQFFDTTVEEVSFGTDVPLLSLQG